MISKVSAKISVLMRNHFVVLCLLCFSFLGANVSAQNDAGTVKGVVVDESNVTVIGATILLNRTGDGTVTDIDGNYVISGVQTGDVLTFSFVGMESQNITYTGQSDLKVELKSTAVGMDELIVVGYGVQKKSDLTGAVSAVSSDEITRKAVSSVAESLQGLTAGVQVTSNGGAPGSGASVSIRGISSINGTTPLYVIDGIPSDNANSINPADIESISILKDASAAAIYGSRGANGVIVVTTKKGEKGFKINFNSQFGVGYVPERMDLLNSEEYAIYVNELNYNKVSRRGKHGEGPTATMDPYNQEYDTDWQEEMFQLAPQQNYNLSVSGGTDHMVYNVSGGYYKQEGAMIETGFEKFTGLANTEWTYGKLKFGENISYKHEYKDNEKNGVGGRNQVEQMLKMTPNIAVYDADEIGGYAGPKTVHGQDAVNPVGIANLYINNSTSDEIVGKLFAEYEFFKGFKYKASYALKAADWSSAYHAPAYTMGDYSRVDDATWSDTENTYRYHMIENVVSYNNAFDDHNVSVVAGASQEWSVYNTETVATKHMASTDETIVSVQDPKQYDWGMMSYFGRVDYNYAHKYYVQGTIRRDGSSRFGENNKWGIFPSVSAGWTLSSEDFMSEVPYLSKLKLRGSYGTIGNQDIGEYGYEASLNPYQSYPFGDSNGEDGVVNAGTGPTSYSNPDLKWEISTQSNIGLDLAFFESRLNITGEYYYNKTDDMLIPVEMPLSNGSFQFVNQNAGSVQNKGFELMVNHKNSIDDFTYSITGNFTTINNEVVDLGTTDNPIFKGWSELGNSTKTMLGQPIGVFFGYETMGLYNSEDQLTEEYAAANGIAYAENAVVGDIQYRNQDDDASLTADDRTIIGSSIPEFTYGANLSMSYKAFDFSMSFQGIYGADIYRETKLWTEGMHTNFNASTDVFDRYIAEDITITRGDVAVDYTANTNTTMPHAQSGNTHNIQFSDRFIEDGSYLRLKDLTIGYTLPRSALDKLHLNQVRVYFTGMNLYTWTDYTGYDPEVPGNAVNGMIDNGQYPQSRTFLGGLQISF